MEKKFLSNDHVVRAKEHDCDFRHFCNVWNFFAQYLVNQFKRELNFHLLLFTFQAKTTRSLDLLGQEISQD